MYRVRVGLADQGHRCRHQNGRRGSLYESCRDECSQAGGQTTRRRGRDEAGDPNGERSSCPDPVAERSSGQEQRGEHQRVTVDDPLQARDPAAEIGADRWKRNVEHDSVEGDDEEPEHRRS